MYDKIEQGRHIKKGNKMETDQKDVLNTTKKG